MKLFKSFSTKIKKLEERFIESKVLIMILPVILILILILFSAPLILNNNQLKGELEAKFSDQLKAELKINGEIKTSLFPVPNITFNELYVRNLFTGSKTIHLHSKKVTVKLSILSAIFAKFDIKSIEAFDTTMEIASSDSISKTKAKDLIKLISQSQLKTVNQKGIGGNLFSIDELNLSNNKTLKKIDFNLTNFNLIYYSKLGNKKQINKINVKTKFKKDSLFADGNFTNQDILNNFAINFNSSHTNKESSILLKSEVLELSAKGKFSSLNKEDFFENFTGTLAAKIFNLKSFYKSFVSSDSYIFKKLKDYSGPITISSSITKKGLDLSIQESQIQSEHITGISNIDITYLEEIPLIDVNLNLDFVDFDKIFSEETQQVEKKDDLKKIKKPKTKDEENKLLADKKIQSDLSKISKDLRDFDLNLELKIEKAKYLFEEINEINLYSSISKNGEVLILPLKFKTPGNGRFRITGIFENRNDNPKFLGHLDATGENLSILLTWLDFKLDNLKYTNLNGYSIYSDIFQKPGSTHFDNLYINIKDGPEILGEANIYHQQYHPYTISKIDVSDFDTSRFIQSSSKNTYLSPGSLVKKLLWINSLNSRNDLEISIDNLQHNNHSYDTNSFKIRIGRGYFEIDDMKIESQDSDLSTSLAIQLKESISKFNLSLKSDKMNIEASKTDEMGFKKNNPDENFSLIDTLFSLPSFEGFGGNVIVDFKDTTIGDTKLSNSKIEAELNNGIVKFRKFRSTYNDGRINFTGSAAVKFDKSLSGNLTLTKFPIQDLFSLYGLENISGDTNIASSISSLGSKKSEFISNLSLKAKYQTSSIIVKNYGLDILIKKMFNFAKYVDEISDPKDILYSKIDFTKVKNSSGSISVNKKAENIFTAKFSGTAFNGTINSKFSNQSLSAQGKSNIIFLTGNKRRQIPINIASNFKGKLSDLEFSDNFSQAQTYITRAKKFYSNPKNKNRNLLKAPSKQKKSIQKSKIINPKPTAPTNTNIPNQQLLEIMKVGSSLPSN